VCSSEEKITLLKKKIPNNIANFSDAIFFPEVETMNHLLLIHDEFKTLIGHICFSNDIDRLESLATIIWGH